MTTELAVTRRTPGVSVFEIPAFPPSVIGVATAIPAFVGYTETARDPRSGKPVFTQPVAVNSMADYQSVFGGGFKPKFSLAAATGADFDVKDPSSGTPPPSPPSISTTRFDCSTPTAAVPATSSRPAPTGAARSRWTP